jgi:hypothetical protein
MTNKNWKTSANIEKLFLKNQVQIIETKNTTYKN